MSTVFNATICCPNCGHAAYRQLLDVSNADSLKCFDAQVMKTECPTCDYFLRMGWGTGQVLEAYIPCRSVAPGST
ncbi:MAG: replication restart DNA helicase PriA [Leptolyngbya sp. RL_3_1]|nr:replication restart DNA helicase PriA [Leptolyngbya sp. RL_3_1]